MASEEGKKRMYTTGYMSLKAGGGPRLGGRRMFYLILGIFLGCALTFVLVQKRARERDSRQMHLDVHEYRAHEKMHPVHDKAHQVSDEAHHAHEKTHEPADDHKPKKSGAATFVATDEWQLVPPDAVLPQGLDIKLDFNTGERKARKHQAKPASDSASSLPVMVHSNTQEQTVMERKLDQIVSKDLAIQQQALEELDLEAHQLPYGDAITHSRNFGNLLHLLEHGDQQLRLAAGSIIVASVHNNPSAVEGVLMAGHVGRLVKRLGAEADMAVLRRILSILTFMAEQNLAGTRHLFSDAHGFSVLEKVVIHNTNHTILGRTMVLLAVLAREEIPDHQDTALALLEKYLPSIKGEVDESMAMSFKPLCSREASHHPPRFQNIASFYSLLLQKQQAEQEERQKQSQHRLEQAASSVEDNFKYWLQFRDPFKESLERITALQKQVTGQSEHSEGFTGGSLRSLRHPNGSCPELTIRHLNESADLDPTAFNLFRKLKYGE